LSTSKVTSKEMQSVARPPARAICTLSELPPRVGQRERKKRRKQSVRVADTLILTQNPLFAEMERKKREQAALAISKQALEIMRFQSALMHSLRKLHVSSMNKTSVMVESDSEDSSCAEDYLPTKPRRY
jgi:hypothetical protein